VLALAMTGLVLGNAREARADLPPGWTKPEAHELSLAAEAARAAGLFDVCIEKDRASLELEERLPTHVHLAGCAEKSGKILTALREMQVVLEHAIETKDADVAELARRRVEQLLQRLASLTITMPAEATDPSITLDDETIDPEALDKPLRLDPGPHRIHAEGVIDGAPMLFDEVKTLAPGEQASLVVSLRPKPSEFLTPGQFACMQAARTQQEVLRCLPGATKPLVVRVALETSGYVDDLPVRIFNPAVRASISSPTAGWHAAASYLVDFVSAASPDFVSTASPRGRDTRHAVSASAGLKPGRLGVDVGGAYSTESDYISRSGNVAALADFAEKRVTQRIGYAFTSDIIGRGGTPTTVFSNRVTAHELSASTSFVLSARTLFIAGATVGIERGDPSKPYRLIPMFARGTNLPAGASADMVNAERLPIRPYEQLPLERDRYALALRFAHRFSGSTLRVEQRVYRDSWELFSSSSDLRYLVDIGEHFLIGPHARFHAQTGATFFHRIYIAETTPRIAVPLFRTTDRELGPLRTYTGGASLWWTVGESSTPSWVLYASGDVLYTSFLDSLYVKSRTGAYGTVGVEAVFE
jgi:hypothetical protein